MRSRFYLFIIALLAAFPLAAQQHTVASGGEASGIGGTVSFTVGQIETTTASDASASVAEGVQQPYEISLSTGLEESSADFSVQVYPNPSSNEIMVCTDRQDRSGLRCRLVDMNGKLLGEQQMLASPVIFPVQALASGTYRITVYDQNKILTAFTVIKK